MSEGAALEQARAALAAAERTIDVLTRRIEQDNATRNLDSYAVRKALAHLEAIVEQRTNELVASEDRFRALYDNSPDMLFTCDLKGEIESANRAALAQLVPPEGPLLGRSVAALFAPEDAASLREALIGEAGLPDTAELRLADGRAVVMRSAWLPDADGYQVILRDITEQRRLEAELQRARRLAAVGQLAAGVAHEINNPLAVIQGRIELVELIGEPVPAALAAHLQVVDVHARRIARTVRSLQAFARSHRPERREVPVAELVRRAADLMGRAQAHRRLVIEIEPPELVAWADPWQVERVIAHLLGNAADASPVGTPLEVHARACEAGVEVRVIDDGQGIPEAVLASLFDPFVSTKEASGSLGLGLALCWGIIQEHGGTIDATNRPEGGACVRFTLAGPPAAATPARDRSNPAT